jgi:3-oxoacyl-[acyl-carrier protein] reductase
MTLTATPSSLVAWRGLAIPDLADKVVLVTGASGGIGRAVALGFAAVGAKVVAQYHAGEAAAATLAAEIEAAGGEVLTLGFDVTDEAALRAGVERAVAWKGRLDGLVNNAGTMMGRVPYETADLAHFDAVFSLNARSAFLAVQAALPALKASKGFVVNTTSIAARHGGSGGAGLYASAKAWLMAATKGMAKEFVPYGIRVNAVAPGVIDTAFHERYSTAAHMDAALKTIPMGRFGTGDDCVGAYLFLASGLLAGYVTGQTIEVNGGQLMP